MRRNAPAQHPDTKMSHVRRGGHPHLTQQQDKHSAETQITHIKSGEQIARACQALKSLVDAREPERNHDLYRRRGPWIAFGKGLLANPFLDL